MYSADLLVKYSLHFFNLRPLLTFDLFSVKVPKSDEEYDLRVPKDMAYIFSGAYIPLSCKLIEQVGPPA